MYTYADLAPDMHLVAVGVVIWVVAISIAFGFYIPVLRAERTKGARRETTATATALPPAPSHTVHQIDSAFAADLAHAPDVGPPSLTLVKSPARAAEAAADLSVAEPATPPDAFSVLIVDDNAINRRVLEIILDSVGVAHVSVENGLEAVEAMEACPHQAVLMDLQMPVMDGFEATRRIRALQAQRGDAPSAIIVVSANCLDEHVAAGRDAGADCHLAKPISAAVLIDELANRSAGQMAA
ncbi:MAG TPA: response regulator [Phenylobacterium sp.]|jgi:CheY-like chemotaxis protein|nr:response regulator [Phenylobacterium sp.]